MRIFTNHVFTHMIRTMLTKRPINLTLSTGTLDAAKRLGINISQVCDEHLREVVRQ